MKVSINKEMNEVTLVGAFDLDGVPTKSAQDAMDAGKKIGIDGLNHGGTGFAKPTGYIFTDAEGQKRELYFGGNFTSHLVKAASAKPKL